MNRTDRSIRLASMAAAALLSLAVVAGLSESLHIDRLAQTPQVITLDAVTVMPRVTTPVTDLADASDRRSPAVATN